METSLAELNIAIFASGNGSNAINLIKKSEELSLRVPILICDQPQARVLTRLDEYETKPFCFPIIKKDGEENDFAKLKREQERDILKALCQHNIHWVFLAGYMRILSKDFLNQFWDEKLKANRVVNIHPSLLPEFPGRHGYRDAFDAGVRESGVTIHFVDGGIDAGDIIAQRKFPRREGDNLDSFMKRGLSLEHQMYPEVLEQLARHHSLRKA